MDSDFSGDVCRRYLDILYRPARAKVWSSDARDGSICTRPDLECRHSGVGAPGDRFAVITLVRLASGICVAEHAGDYRKSARLATGVRGPTVDGAIGTNVGERPHEGIGRRWPAGQIGEPRPADRQARA